MSTTLLIGRWPAAIRRAFSHGGDGPIVTSSKTRAVKRGHRSGPRRRPRRRRSRRRVPGSSLHGGGAERRAGRRVDLARDAVDAEAVGPVRRDLELEHVGGDRQHARPAACRARAPSSRTMIPAWSVPIAELVLGQDHPVGLDAAQLGRAELRAVGHDRARPRDGDGLAGGDVRRAADDLLRARRRRRRPCRRVSRSASGWCSALEHAPDDEALERADAVVVDAPRPSCRSSSGAPRAADGVRPGSQYSRSQSSGTRIIRTAPGSAGRCRRTGAGRGRRA